MGDPAGTGTTLSAGASEEAEIRSEEDFDDLADKVHGNVKGGALSGAVGGPMGALAATEAGKPNAIEKELAGEPEPNSPEAMERAAGMG